MKKKGFTLMELLAVIVILAVIALITFPIVSNVIKTSKKNVFKLSVGQVSDNIFFHYTKDWLLSNITEDIVFDFDTNENINLLTVSGRLPSSGTISINPQGKISINVNDGVYCAVKNIDQSDIQVGEIVNGTCEITGEAVNNCSYAVGYKWDFNYISTGEDRSQEFSVPCKGNYRLEVWGASGAGSNAGSGGYSTGEIVMNEEDKIYITVGGQGVDRTSYIGGAGGFNGGGNGSNAYSTYVAGTGGGGATHIAFERGLLSTFENKINQLIIVAGGGGGVDGFNETAGSGGGIAGGIGNNAGSGSSTGGTQTTGYQFGIGGHGAPGTSYGGSGEGNGGSGGGLYGGYTISNRNNSSTNSSGAGGSGYIGYSELKNKYMYCYNCPTSLDESTYTITGRSTNSSAYSSTAKRGDGYARITYLGKKANEKIITCVEGMSWEFNYKESNGAGVEQTFTPTCTGYYKLEVWGAQGGSAGSGYPGGYGGYATGTTKLTKDIPVYVNVGGTGKQVSGYDVSVSGGYNGGGIGYGGGPSFYRYSSSGGGATHIALASGLLTAFNPTLENSIHNQLLIVAGGGSGTWYTGTPSNWETRVPGYGGGFKGTNSTAISEGTYYYGQGGTQDSGYAFGQGYNAINTAAPGGGGGYYGGNANSFGAAGGSGYIGNSNLYKKVMYCYKCEESTEISTNTKSTLTVSSNPVSNTAKTGSGYARITYIGEKIDNSYNTTEGEIWNYTYKEESGNGVEQTFTTPVKGLYKLEVWGAQGGGYSSYVGGYGGYSTGEIELNKGTILYINVGSQGESTTSSGNGLKKGGYNGGGSGYSGDSYNYPGGGGGASHIAFASGLLTAFNPTIENNINNKLIIAAGGGGAGFYYSGGSKYGYGGHGGGYIAGSGTTNTSAIVAAGGTQDNGGAGNNAGSFGQGGTSGWGTGAGGGYYGGGASPAGVVNEAYNYTAGGGGSGYIGNNLLANKHMYCYNCQQSPSTNVNTYTISKGNDSCKDGSPVSDCAKLGNGYVRITLLEIK